jgi:hypothetical protein
MRTAIWALLTTLVVADVLKQTPVALTQATILETVDLEKDTDSSNKKISKTIDKKIKALTKPSKPLREEQKKLVAKGGEDSKKAEAN